MIQLSKKWYNIRYRENALKMKKSPETVERGGTNVKIPSKKEEKPKKARFLGPFPRVFYGNVHRFSHLTH